MGGLLAGGTIVLYDGSPSYPNMDVLWNLAEETEVTFFSTSAFISTNLKFGVNPNERYSFKKLKAICSTGSPLSINGLTGCMKM